MLPTVVFVVLGFIFYLGVRSFREKSRVKLEISKEKQKMSVGYDQAFEWNAAIDSEKGVASGSVKIGKFSKPGFWAASFLLAAAVFCVMIPGLTVIGVILFSASFFTYYRWYSSLQVKERVQAVKKRGKEVIDAVTESDSRAEDDASSLKDS